MTKLEIQTKIKSLTAIINGYEEEAGNSFAAWSKYPCHIQSALQDRLSLSKCLRGASA